VKQWLVYGQHLALSLMAVVSIQQEDKWKRKSVSTGLTGVVVVALALAFILISTIGVLILGSGM
jgi:hypothetical protein